MDFDWSNPEAFMQAIGAGKPGGLPMPKIADASAVKSEAKQRSQSIFKNYNTLKTILGRHEATIQKRWLKKTKDSRRSILQKAWCTKLPATHRPDFVALRKKSQSQQQVDSKSNRSMFLWPYINEEDLTKPRAFLLLLNSRGRYPPAEFAAADGEAMHLGIVSTAIVPVFLNEYVMVFTGRHEARSYGEVLNWDDHPDAFQWMMTGKCPQPGKGLLILEAQDEVMRFLVACVKEILHDVPEVSLTEGPKQSQPASVSEDDAGFRSLAVMAAEAPYRVPAKISFSRIENLLTARRDAAADHMWSLREDPAYFADLMCDSKEHRQELLQDTNGQAHPLFRHGREDILWGRVIGSEVSGAFLCVEFWDDLAKQASLLKRLQVRYEGRLKPEDDLAEDFLAAILKFQHHLKQVAKGAISQLKLHFTASPPMRAIFARQPESNPTQTRIIVTQRPGYALEKTESDLLWLARILWEDGRELFLARMPNVVDELQRLIDSEPKVKKMITPFIAGIISDLAILCECLRQLDLFQPWANTFENAMVERQSEIQEDYSKISGPWSRVYNALKGSDGMFALYGSPTNSRFYYPVEKRKTKDNTEAMQKAEANLDEFWKNIDKLLHAKAGNLNNLAIPSLLSQRTLQRTANWHEPNKQPQSDPEPAPPKPLSEIYFDLEHRTKKTLDAGPTKPIPTPKQKTRGPPTSHPEPTTPQANNLQPPQLFQVDHKALKVFKTLFYTPSISGTPGDIPWTDFLHALSSVGFAHEKLYGSVWQFSPTRLDVERSIQFHEPHPSGKIPYRVARRYGRRLNRAYGWEGSVFGLEGGERV